jgi:hypothetical protein
LIERKDKVKISIVVFSIVGPAAAANNLAKRRTRRRRITQLHPTFNMYIQDRINNFKLCQKVERVKESLNSLTGLSFNCCQACPVRSNRECQVYIMFINVLRNL